MLNPTPLPRRPSQMQFVGGSEGRVVCVCVCVCVCCLCVDRECVEGTRNNKQQTTKKQYKNGTNPDGEALWLRRGRHLPPCFGWLELVFALDL